MKIVPTAWPLPVMKKQAEPEPPISKEVSEPKQVLQQAAQQHVAELTRAQNETGEDNPKVQVLMEKFKSGQKLTPEEMTYIRKYAPGQVDYVDRIMREREIMELSMKASPTKTDVQLTALSISKKLSQQPSSEDLAVRASHLANAKYEYEQTEDYKSKPNSPLEPKKRKPLHTTKQATALAKLAYKYTEATKATQKDTTI